MPSIVIPADGVAAKRIESVGEIAHALIPSGFIEGCKKGVQPQDVVWPAQMAIEKGQGNLSTVAVSSADIEKHFANIKNLQIAQWQTKQGVEPWVLFFNIRLHSLVPLSVLIGDGPSFTAPRRTRGI